MVVRVIGMTTWIMLIAPKGLPYTTSNPYIIASNIITAINPDIII